MTANYVGSPDDRGAVIEYLLANVQNVVNAAGSKIGRVKDAYFVESRVRPSSAPKTVATDSASNNSFVALASSLACAAVVTMLVFYFVAARRRRKSKSDSPTNTMASKDFVVMGRDSNMNSVPTATTTSVTTFAEKSGDFVHENEDAEVPSCLSSIEPPVSTSCVPSIEPPVSIDAVSTPITVPISLVAGRTASTTPMDDSESDNENPPPDQFEEELKRTLNIPPNDDEFKNVGTSSCGENGPTVMVDISKPPKPPTAPSNKPPVPMPVSKPLKKRRKLKKKKKTSAAVRSREIVAGMETIAEGIEEETSANDKSGAGDDDSEYSWYSTSDSEPGSRDPSPARSRDASPSRSFSSSRDESPSRSISEDNKDGTVKPRWV